MACRECSCEGFVRHLWKGETICTCLHDLSVHNGGNDNSSAVDPSKRHAYSPKRALPSVPPQKPLGLPPRAPLPQVPPKTTSLMEMVRQASPMPTERSNASSTFTLSDVMTNPSLLDSFEQYLQNESTPSDDGLAALHFAFACDQYANAPNEDQMMEIANEIYDLHFSTVYIPEDIVNQVAEVESLDKNTFKLAHDYILKELEHVWMPSFLSSGLVSINQRRDTLAAKESVVVSQDDWWCHDTFREHCIASLPNAEGVLAFLDGVLEYRKLHTDEERNEIANVLFKNHLLPDSEWSVPLSSSLLTKVLSNDKLTRQTFDEAFIAVRDWLKSNSQATPTVSSGSVVGAVNAAVQSLTPTRKLPTPPPPAPIKPPIKSVDECTHDIIESEKAFVAQMDLFTATFIQPVLFGEGKVSKENQHVLFSHIDPCLTIHRKLLNDLESNDSIADVFLKLSDFFKVYTQYCNNFGDASKLLLRLLEEDTKKKVPEFSTFVQRCMDIARDSGSEVDILESLVLPVQRVEAYPLLLRCLSDALGPDSTQTETLIAAIDKFDALLVNIKTSEKQYGDVQHILEIGKKMDGDLGSLDLVEPGRVFLREGDVMCVVQKKGGFFKKEGGDLLEERHIFLFNDVLVLTNKSLVGKVLGKKYHYKDHFLLKGSEVKEVSDTDILHDAFSIRCSDRTVTFCALSGVERKRWIKAIDTTMQSGGRDTRLASIATPSDGTLRTKYGDILIKMKSRGGIHVEEHKQMLRLFPKTFIGNEAIDWLLTYGDIGTREEASDLMNELLEDGVIKSVGFMRKSTYSDDSLSLYVFAEEKQGKKGGAAEDAVSKQQQLKYIRQGPKSVQEQLETAALEERTFLLEECERLRDKHGPDGDEVKNVEAILFAFEHQVAVIMPWMAES